MFSPRLACVALLGLLAPSVELGAQESPVRRAANIVIVAVEEYAKGVDDRGRLTAESEYQEAIGFLQDAKQVTDRLTGERSETARVLLDSIIAAARSHRPPQALLRSKSGFPRRLGARLHSSFRRPRSASSTGRPSSPRRVRPATALPRLATARRPHASTPSPPRLGTPDLPPG